MVTGVGKPKIISHNARSLVLLTFWRIIWWLCNFLVFRCRLVSFHWTMGLSTRVFYQTVTWCTQVREVFTGWLPLCTRTTSDVFSPIKWAFHLSCLSCLSNAFWTHRQGWFYRLIPVRSYVRLSGVSQENGSWKGSFRNLTWSSRRIGAHKLTNLESTLPLNFPLSHYYIDAW